MTCQVVPLSVKICKCQACSFLGLVDFAVDSFTFRPEILAVSIENLEFIAEHYRRENKKKFRKRSGITFVGIHNRRGDHLEYQKEGGFIPLDPGYFLNVSVRMGSRTGNYHVVGHGAVQREVQVGGVRLRVRRHGVGQAETSTWRAHCWTPRSPLPRPWRPPSICRCCPCVTTPSPLTAPTPSGRASWQGGARA